MVVALREVAVRGEIHTILDYAVDMLQAREGGGKGGGVRGIWAGRGMDGGRGAARPPHKYLCEQA